jgi:hypothetical protein
MTDTTKRDVRYVTIEPGRISLHGIALSDAEYAVLRGIAERMKRAQTVAEVAREATA